ncbi:MAG: dihydrolipoyl dehydrogenase [Pseudomonadota bacterium]|nr:dihydrolipoyl dehydrogenase [Pseudomonadota bacterium]
MANYDFVIIGGGPGGYIAAIRAAQLGFTVACIEKRKNKFDQPALGGTCLNVGCIPSKALLDTSHHYLFANEHFEQHGLSVKELAVDVKAMISRKDDVVKKLIDGVAGLFKAHKIDWLQGSGQLQKNKQVKFTSFDGEEQLIDAKHIILATGSVPINIPPTPIDNETGIIVDSTGALEFTEVPKTLGVIGAGVIGLELGSVWARLGAKVVIFEAMGSFLPMVDSQASKELLKQLKKQGLDVQLGAKVKGSSVNKNSVNVTYDLNGEEQSAEFEKLIVAVGRKPYVEGLLADGVDLKMSDRGQIEVDESYKTNIEGVYAIGDLIHGPALAHKAMEEGVVCVERIEGEQSLVNYDLIPSVIYTHPELAWVGQSEDELKEQGVEYKSGAMPFAANGRALAADDAEGMVKFVADEKTDRILGCTIIGPQASELLQQIVIAMEFGATIEDIQLTMFSHPSLSEVVHEAALAVDQRALHKAQRKRKKK